MSTSPDRDATRADDDLVGLLSHWLARHVDDADLLAGIERTDLDELEPAQREAVGELVEALRDPNGHAGDLEMIVRETLEALALGG
jgi:hypothetical protein